MELKEIKSYIKQKPYFETDNLVLYNNDCSDILKQMPDKCIDLVLTDPPYGIKADDTPIRGKFKYEKLSFDLKPIEKNYFDEIFRISENQIIWGGELLYKLFIPKTMLVSLE